MRVVASLVTAVMLTPSVASSQEHPSGIPASSPTIYVCTAAAQVVEIAPTGTSHSFKVIASGSGSVTGCVMGPDGWLYLANGLNLARVDVETASAGAMPAVPEQVGPNNVFASSARGLAFNLNTLYVTTASSGVYAVSFDTGAPLTFSDAQQILPPPGAGRGIAFDVDGDLIFASGTTIQRSTTPQYIADYSTPSPIATGTSAFAGVGVNPCDDVLFTNPTGLSIRRLENDEGTYTDSGIVSALFASKERPNDLRIDPSNRLYVLTGEDDTGKNAKVFILTPVIGATDKTGGLESCSAYTKGSPLVELKSRLSGPNKIPFLTSATALGIAIGPSAHTLTHSFTASLNPCERNFNFGYHAYHVKFEQCPAFDLAVTAHKTEPLAATFGGVFPFPPSPIQYSPMGGFATEYQLTPSAQPDTEYLAILGFFTQQFIVTPGVARAGDADHPLYDENLGTEFWDIGPLDPSGGVRDRDFSWHVMFNSAPASEERACQLPVFLDPPMNGTAEDLSPLFNGPQTLSLSFTASGTNCSGALVRVSIARVVGNPPVMGETPVFESWEPQTVRSNAQTSNIMSSVGNSYKYNLDASALDTTGATASTPALFQITIWGELAPPQNYYFQVSKQ